MNTSPNALKVGLTQIQAQSAIEKFGYNEFESQKLKTTFANILKILRDPMGLMLLFLSVLYWFLGEKRDAVVLMIAYIPIVGVDVLLDLRSQTALRSLSRTLKSTCRVIRDSKLTVIPIRNLVPGDALVLEEGQTIPADGTPIESSNLTIDESSVTGESIPVDKKTGDGVLSGTTLIAGAATVAVTKTGLSSQIGSVAKVLMAFEATPSPLLRVIKKIVGYVSLGALGIAGVVFVVDYLRGRALAPSLISSLTLAMAAIPEEFPVVFTLYLSLAAFRLSKKSVLVKSLPSVEGLGRIDILCTDKTGTLTEGKFKLEKVLSLTGEIENAQQLLTPLVFSCEIKAVDAIEASILSWVREHSSEGSIETIHQAWTLKYDHPFLPTEKYMSHVWAKLDSSEQVVVMKGALESVLKHCDVSPVDYEKIMALGDGEARSGRRILGLASKAGTFTASRDQSESALQFIGILSFNDPVRANVKATVAACLKEQVGLKILTGDYLVTTKSVADEIGVAYQPNQLYSGPDLEKLSIEERKQAFENGIIFARLKPDQKLELVTELKARGHIVAMTGDGINDAPALKLADIGISMGDRATDVARSTAQLVLLKNDFSGIVDAIREGRRVMNSLGESFGYLIAFHIPIIAIGLIQSFFMATPLLLPIHIVLMQLIVHPISAFVFDEASAASGLRRKQFITFRRASWSLVRGVLLTSLTLGVFSFFKGSDEVKRSLALSVLIMGNVGLLFAEVGVLFLAARSPVIYKRTWFAAILLIILTILLTQVNDIAVIFAVVPVLIQPMMIVILFGISLGLAVPISFNRSLTEASNLRGKMRRVQRAPQDSI